MGKKATFYLINVIIAILTIFISALTIICHFTNNNEVVGSRLLTILNLGLLPIIIFNVILILYWVVRRNFIFIIPLAAVIINYSFLSATFQFPSKSEDNSFDIKVATYNVHYFNTYKTKYNVETIADYLKKEEVDVVCLQEFSQSNNRFNLDSIRAAFSEMKYYEISQSKQNGNDLAIFSRFPLSDMKLYTFDYSQNGFMSVNIDVNGREILLLNVHLQTTSVSSSQKELDVILNADLTEHTKNSIETFINRLIENNRYRANQINDICKIIEESELPVIVCGDFNDIPSSYVYKRMTEVGLKDGFKTAGSGYAYTFSPFCRLLRIDYIFHNDLFEGVDYYSDRLDLSDHLPVIMELKIK